MTLDLPLAADIYVGIILFCLGACMGSFVTCAADRRAKSESMLRGRSHCDACGAKLGALELIPIVSYILLRGRCKHCGERIPIRCLLAEAVTGLIYLATYLCFGFGFITLEYVLLFTALIAVALIDTDSMEIPDGLIVFGTALFLIFLYPHGGWEARLEDGVFGAVVFGGGMLFVSTILDAILKRESLGGGDIKLFAMLGLFTGVAIGLVMVILACAIGLIEAAALGVNKKSGAGDRSMEFPFGPAIVTASVAALLVGQDVVSLYLSAILG